MVEIITSLINIQAVDWMDGYVTHRELAHTVRCRYNAVQYDIIFHTAL